MNLYIFFLKKSTSKFFPLTSQKKYKNFYLYRFFLIFQLDTTELIIILGASLALTLTFDIPCQELKKKFLTSSKVIKKDKSELSLEMKNNEEINNNNQIIRKRLQSRGT